MGLKIDGFEDARVNKLSPELLENMGITVESGQLVVPIENHYDYYGRGRYEGAVTIGVVIHCLLPGKPGEAGSIEPFRRGLPGRHPGTRKSSSFYQHFSRKESNDFAFRQNCSLVFLLTGKKLIIR